MDGHRFDALVRSFASGTSRRRVLKGLLGIGGAAVIGGDGVEAARRSTPTPRPVTCSPPKVPSGGQCVCPGGTTPCGPDCCPNGQAECCDNACCYGECYGEEICCPYAQQFCPVSGECCPEGWRCCPESGCIPPGGCCEIGECEPRACHQVACGPNSTCDYTFNCGLDDDCCPDELCADGWCQENGACGDPIFDCRVDGDEVCCGGKKCLPDGSCCLREYCDITEECCGEFERCCPGYGCIPFDGCCEISECEERDCFSIACDFELGCLPTRDCREGSNCCPDPGGCYRAVCLDDGTCGEPAYDCTRGTEENPCCPPNDICLPDGSCVDRVCDCREDDECCPNDLQCYAPVCQEDGTCGEPEPDCRGWDDEVCCPTGTFCKDDGRCRCDCREDDGCCPDRLCQAAICKDDGTCGGFEFNCLAGDDPEKCCRENEVCRDDGTCFCDCRRERSCCPEEVGVCQNDGTCVCVPECGGGALCNQDDGCGGTCACTGASTFCNLSTNTCQECPYAINWAPCGGEDGQNPACRIVCNTENELQCVDTRFESGLDCDDRCVTSADCPLGAQCVVRSACFGSICLWPCPDDLEVDPPPGP